MASITTSVDLSTFLPGDVLVVNASKGRGVFSGGWWIKLRNLITGVKSRSRYADHVLVVHHRDSAGNLWGIEGKPSSVGWVDCALYLNHGKLVTDNRLQPKSDEQRAAICKMASEMLGTKYDWVAIADLGVQALNINRLWSKAIARFLLKDWNEDEVPGHVICSSFLDVDYEHLGLDSPGGTDGTRFTTPSDWSEFIFESMDAWTPLR